VILGRILENDVPNAAICTFVGIFLAPFFNSPHHRVGILFPLAGLVIDLVRRNWRMTTVGRDIKSMLDLPIAEEQFPVRILLTHQDILYGEDRGVLSVLEGGLHFTGKRTDFSLSQRNARLKGDAHRLSNSYYGNVVNFVVQGLQCRLAIVPLGRTSLDAGKLAGRVLKALQGWDERTWVKAWVRMAPPPIVPQPELYRASVRAVLVAKALLPVACLVMAAVLLKYFLGRQHSTFDNVYFIFVFVSYCVMGWLTFSKVLRRKRVLQAMMESPP
jgi:hypothetical protein